MKSVKIIVLFFFAIVLSACSQKVPASDVNTVSQAAPLVIRLAGGDYGLPSPFTHSTRGPGLYNMYLLFDGLLEKDEKGLIPWLATDWKIEKGGKSYLFTIRDNVHWHDGTLLTAEDVKFSYDYYLKHPPVRNMLVEGKETFVEKVEIVGKNQVRITVKQPNASYLEKIGFSMKIIPKHIWEGVDNPVSMTDPKALVGSGPYTLDDYNGGQGTYRFKAFDPYWGPKPRVDVIEQVPVSEPVLAFEKGELDIAEITPDVLSRFQNNPEYRVIQNPPFHGVRLNFNMEKRPELKDKAVRQAFAYAIDQADLVEKVLRGAGIPGSAGYLPQEHPYYNNKIKPYPFDPAKAKQLLNGKELTFKLNIPNTEQTVRTAELIKISLKKAGIVLNVQTYDTKTNDEMARSGNYELTLSVTGGWGGDPDLLRMTFATNPNSQGSSGTIGYKNEAINQLAAKQMVEPDENKRHEIINQLQEQIAEEVPALTLFNQKSYFVFRPNKFDGWMYMYDHHYAQHSKLTYLTRK
ncbi:ABC transporter substrate-binding protein [Paenibacillus sp. WQ 127069]|uniref:ABC transporter substrate-binding protein n=1 Tax=Paenibacillus baimaensis TaxID=2982185 RepID=A0ABT2UDU3_9BACL|nr:ABC transporter substrate-binding protein [Paenibacillus sp. WQ 127069]MCU6792799.1 ABC transporter substrate-binding protein [Paenibacillus sp. WQ 127069]